MTQSRAISFQLEQLILDGGLAPGQKLPSERQLAFRLGVSRALVREALHELQGRGVIRTHHGKGSFVASILPGTPEADDSSALMHLYSGHSRTLYDLLEVREQLEGQAAHLAAQRATNMDRVRITRAFERLGETDPLSNAEPDHGFHQAIVEASHNPVLVHILNGLKKMMLLTVQASVANLNPREELRQTIMKQHRRLHRAVLSGRAEAAQKAAASHVRFVITSLRQLEEEGASVTRPTDAKNLHCSNVTTQ